jgi:aspartyl-tRNA(Asn)/glutamyl-tRNA(Gln) amidotransferase subunit C
MIDKEQIRKTAHLARLELSPEEIEKLSVQLSEIMAYAESINQLDLKDVKPTAHAVEVENVFRDGDEPVISGIIGKAIENAPDHDGIFFRVPKVL